MRIGIFCPDFPPASAEGGISHFVHCLARNLSDSGDDIFVIAGKSYCGPNRVNRIHVLRFREKWDRRMIKEVDRELRLNQIELINLQYSPVMYPASFKLAWNYLAKKFVSTVSFHTLWGGSKHNFFFAFNLLNGANGVIATNSEVIYLLKKYLPWCLKKTCFIPIGSNILPQPLGDNDARRIHSRYSLSSDQPFLAYFGMVYPGKGLKLLFEAARILLFKYNLEFKLVLIGGGISDAHDYIQQKKRLVESFGLQDKVIFTGKIPAVDVSMLLDASRLVVLPFLSGASDRRGSLMAALAHNKAVVTTKPTVPIETFKNCENILWPENSDAANLADAIRQVFDEPLLRKQLEAGARALSAKYRWSVISNRTQQFFRFLVGRSRKPQFLDSCN